MLLPNVRHLATLFSQVSQSHSARVSKGASSQVFKANIFAAHPVGPRSQGRRHYAGKGGVDHVVGQRGSNWISEHHVPSAWVLCWGSWGQESS